MVQLEQIEAVLQDADYTAHIQNVPGQTDACLEVSYGRDEMGRDRILYLSLRPSLTDDGTTTQFVKFFVKLPFQAPSNHVAETAHAVTILNEELAIGHFGMALQGDLHYQYSLALKQEDPISSELLVELVALIEFQQEHFSDYLEGVCNGELSVAVLPTVIRQTPP